MLYSMGMGKFFFIVLSSPILCIVWMLVASGICYLLGLSEDMAVKVGATFGFVGLCSSPMLYNMYKEAEKANEDRKAKAIKLRSKNTELKIQKTVRR